MPVSSAARDKIARRITHLQRVRDQVVIDGDTHPSDPARYPPSVRERVAATPNYYHGRPITGEELLREMDQAGVDMALSWQNPAVTPYGDDHDANFRALLEANRYIFELSERHPERFLPAGWTDPKALGIENALKLVDICVEEFGFPIVKMNPAQNAYPIDSEMVFTVVDRIVGHGAATAFHYGGDTEFTPAEGLERVALRHPDRPVIGVHMGGGGAHYLHGEETYQKSRALGLRRPNVFFIQSAKRDTHIESDLIEYRMAGAPFSRNIAIASDCPYGRLTWNFGGYRCMFDALRDGANHNDPRLQANPGLFDDATVQNYMGRNLADLILRIDRGLAARA